LASQSHQATSQSLSQTLNLLAPRLTPLKQSSTPLQNYNSLALCLLLLSAFGSASLNSTCRVFASNTKYNNQTFQHELAQADVRLLTFNLGNPGSLTTSLANVAGTQEPIYGPEAIQPVTKQAEKTPYTVLKKEDLKWQAHQYTSVETQTFYIMADNGALAWVQVIYSNVA
jgi:hypothetical protein